MNQIAKIQEVVLWAMLGSFIPTYQGLGGNGWGLFFMMAFWLFYGLRLGAELCKNVHSQVMKAQHERNRMAEYAEPPQVHRDLTIHLYPLIEHLLFHSPRTFSGLIFNVMGKNYQITHVHLNAATVYASLEETTSAPSESVAFIDLRK